MLEHFKGDEVFVKKILDYQFQALQHQRMILTIIHMKGKLLKVLLVKN